MKNFKQKILSSTFLSSLSLFVLLSKNILATDNIQISSIEHGNAEIKQTHAETHITTSTDKAVINYHKLNIGNNELLQFHQPSNNSIVLNRVITNNKSEINGQLISNGKVIIINQNGIEFGTSARVDVNGLIASTIDIDTEEFIKNSDQFHFDKPSKENAAIINNGTITAKDAGMIGLVAPKVINNGIIKANSGTAQLASGDSFTLDLYGDRLIEIAVSDELKSSLIKNNGLIETGGGKILLTAAAGKEIVDNLIEVKGELKAPAISEKNGEIYIFAEGSDAVKDNIRANKGQRKGSSLVLVDGKINSSGTKSGEAGGKITILADEIVIGGKSEINASGFDGKYNSTLDQKVSAPRNGSSGGEIKIGGDYLGQGLTPTASFLYFDADATIYNDSLNSGDAGRTILWSDGKTFTYGSIYSRSLGHNPGNGGFLETSGHKFLDATLKDADLTSKNGEHGTYFLDPDSIKIYNISPNSVLADGGANLSSNIQLWLNAANTTEIQLTYIDQSAASVTASGSTGNNSVILSGSYPDLVVGQKIILSDPNPAPALASATNSDAYIISAIEGNKITFTQNLSRTYSNVKLYVGLVSRWDDLTTNARNAAQTSTLAMPKLLFNGPNSLSVISFDGSNQGLDVNLSFMNDATSGYNSIPHTNFATAQTTTYGSFYQQVASYGTVYEGFRNDLETTQYRMDYTAGDDTLASLGVTSGSVEPSAAFIPGSYNNVVFKWEKETSGGPNTKTIYTNTHEELVSEPAGTIGPYTTESGKIAYGDSGTEWGGNMAEIIMYNTPLSDNNINLINQYLSGKWGVTLSPPGSGSNEATKAMASTAKGDAADGYSVFNQNYLSRLSQSMNIDLQATNDITIALDDTSLNIATGKNFSLKSVSGDIKSISPGSIITTANSSRNGGNINVEALNGSIDFVTNGTLNLLSQNGGSIALTAGDYIKASYLSIGDATTPQTINVPTAFIATKAYNRSTNFRGSISGESDSIIKYTGKAVLSSSGLGTETTTLNALGVILSPTSGSSGTYSINTTTSLPLTVTTTKAPLDVKAKSYTIYYGQPLPTLTYTYSGLIEGDTSSFAGSLQNISQYTIGTFPVNRGSLIALGNYFISSYNEGYVNILTPPSSQINKLMSDKTYNMIINNPKIVSELSKSLASQNQNGRSLTKQNNNIKDIVEIDL